MSFENLKLLSAKKNKTNLKINLHDCSDLDDFGAQDELNQIILDEVLQEPTPKKTIDSQSSIIKEPTELRDHQPHPSVSQNMFAVAAD